MKLFFCASVKHVEPTHGSFNANFVTTSLPESALLMARSRA